MHLRRLLSPTYRRIDRQFLDSRFGGTWSGTKWKFRHIYKRSWAKRYLTTKDEKHRKRLITMIESRFPQCETVCEYGCGSGVNLFNLWAANLATRYYGFDINPSGIRMANQHAKRIGAANLTFKRANLVNSEVPYTNKYEVIITDAVLMFIGHNLIADVLRKTWNATTRGMVLHEFNGATALDGGRYIHDFRVLMSMIDPSAEVEIIRSPKDDSEQWSLFGSFVCITRTDPPARQTFQP